MRPVFSHSLFWYVVGFALVVAVVIVCLLPAQELPSLEVSDKTEHLLAYLALAIWFGGLVEPRSYPWLFLCLLVMGGGIEIAQALMNVGRHAEWRDFLADGIGALAGLLLCFAGLRHWVSWIERWTGRQ